jgi:hypothetical protein
MRDIQTLDESSQNRSFRGETIPNGSHVNRLGEQFPSVDQLWENQGGKK